jgi:hypothetical protein
VTSTDIARRGMREALAERLAALLPEWLDPGRARLRLKSKPKRSEMVTRSAKPNPPGSP